MEDNEQQVEGSVSSIIFQNEENFYTAPVSTRTLL